MKISLNWIREFTAVDIGVEDLVVKIGAQLGAVEEAIDLGKKYQGIMVAKVVSCEKHPNADKLQVCLIDDGGVANDVARDENGRVQVVCGAPNAREGLLVAWLPPGVIVPSTHDKDPLTLEAREIRGVVSNGMLASSHELGISDDHAGILEVDYECLPGADFADIYKFNDYIIDIENKMFTHRPDCFGIIGVAREIAGITGAQFTSPEWYKQAQENLTPRGEDLPLVVKNEAPTAVPRFMAVALRNITIKPSSIYIQSYLTRVGIRPINNVVDITNYVMHLTGQPLHAYDYDKVKAQDPDAEQATLVARFPAKGEKITLLNGKTIEPRQEAVMIASATKLIGIGGVMGGADTEVDSNTKNIILECANFDMYSIRRTAMEHGLFTDAVTRFTKGQSAQQNDKIITFAARMICDLGDTTEFASELIDINNISSEAKNVQVPAQFINDRLGLQLSVDAMAALLRNVEFDVEGQGSTLHITVPFWRTDIDIAEDIVEEIGRLYGYDKLPLELPKRDLTPAKKDELLELKSRVREVLSTAGANEVLTYSFVHGNLLENAGQKPEDSYQLSNALSPQLQYYRQTLTPSLLDKVHANIKAGFDEFALFELNKTHNKIHGLDDEKVPGELNMLALVCANKQPSSGAAYYQARKYLDSLAGTFGFTLTYQPMQEDPGFPVTQPFNCKRSALVTIRENDVFLGIIGEYRPEVARKFKLPVHTAGFELGTEHLLEAIRKTTASRYTPLPRFPKVEQDISLKVVAELSYGELYDFVWEKIEAFKPAQALATLEPLDIYQKGDDKDHRQVTLRLTIASYERTLTAPEVNALLDQVAAAAKDKFHAERL